MGDNRSKKGKSKEQEVVLSPPAARFNESIDTLIKLGMVKDQTAFSKMISIDDTTISRVRSGQRQLRLEHLENACRIFNLNANHFILSEPNLFTNEAKKTDAPTFNTSGSGNTVVNGNNYGEINTEYEQIAENIYNQHAPPELENDLRTLVDLTKGIKKMNDDYEIENGNLKQKLEEKEIELKETKKELGSVKDELLDFYRGKNSK